MLNEEFPNIRLRYAQDSRGGGHCVRTGDVWSPATASIHKAGYLRPWCLDAVYVASLNVRGQIVTGIATARYEAIGDVLKHDSCFERKGYNHLHAEWSGRILFVRCFMRYSEDVPVRYNQSLERPTEYFGTTEPNIKWERILKTIWKTWDIDTTLCVRKNDGCLWNTDGSRM